MPNNRNIPPQDPINVNNDYFHDINIKSSHEPHHQSHHQPNHSYSEPLDICGIIDPNVNNKIHFNKGISVKNNISADKMTLTDGLKVNGGIYLYDNGIIFPDNTKQISAIPKNIVLLYYYGNENNKTIPTGWEEMHYDLIFENKINLQSGYTWIKKK